MKKFLRATALMMLVGVTTVIHVANAKLPPLSDEAKATAEEAKAKSTWTGKVSAYKLCLSQDKVAAAYRKAKGADAKPATETPACQDPGPFVPPVAAAAPAASAASVAPTPATAVPASAKK